MTRIFRITTLIKLLKTDSHKYSLNEMDHSIYNKIRQLLGQTAIIIPIVVKFFPFFLITYYLLGVIGMEIFFYAEQTAPTEDYGMYK